MIRNLRDLGGIPTIDGHKIKKGIFYRSALLNEITDEDLAWFKEKNITQIIDLRTQGETRRAPDTKIPGTTYTNFYLQDDNGGGLNVKQMRERIAAAKTEEEQIAYIPDMSIVYREMITNDFSRSRFCAMVKQLATYTNGASLFHCTSGKDRTGMTAASICLIAGVDYEAILDDYLISLAHAEWESAKMRENFKKQGMGDALTDRLIRLFTIDKNYLDAFFSAMKDRCGSIENFIRNDIGISDDELADIRMRILE